MTGMTWKGNVRDRLPRSDTVVLLNVDTVRVKGVSNCGSDSPRHDGDFGRLVVGEVEKGLYMPRRDDQSVPGHLAQR
jgi:hypothetical protein